MAEIRLRPGGRLYRLSDELKKQASASQDVENRFSGRHPKDYLTEYLGWVNEASRMLGSDLRRTELEALLHTRSYWTLRQMDGSEAWLTGQIRGELQARREAFTEMAAEAEKLARHWQVYGIVVMPDTNVLLHATKIFDELDWPCALGIDSTTIYLVIPMVVIDELDGHKRGRQEIRSIARQTASKLEDRLGSHSRVLLSKPPDVSGIVSAPEIFVEVLVDPLDHTRLPDSDSEIVDRALYLRELTQAEVVIATWDSGMRFRASSVGIRPIKPLAAYERLDEPSGRGRQARGRPADCGGGAGGAEASAS